MTITLDTVLLFVALACFVLAALGVTLHPRLGLGWLGLACWVATVLTP